MNSLVKIDRKRILLLAYACSPFRGSEPGIGWHWAIEMAKYFDIWVICETKEFKADIDRYFALNEKINGLHFQFVSKSDLEYLWSREK